MGVLRFLAIKKICLPAETKAGTLGWLIVMTRPVWTGQFNAAIAAIGIGSAAALDCDFQWLWL